MTKVSLIIPSYNSFKTIGQTLESLLAQDAFDVIQEIIVIDSSDDKETRNVIHNFSHAKLKVHFLNQKTSPALGRNEGAKLASGELLCFIDSDVYLSPDWVKKIVKSYEEGCKAGSGSVDIPDFQKKSHLALAQLYLQFNESLPVGQQRQVAMVPSCNMFVEKKLFDQVGGFPDIRASEDVLLCLKIGETSPVWFLPQARCFHIFREDKQSYFKNQIVLGKYIIVYRRMKYDRWFYKGLWPFVLLPAFLVIKMSRIKLRIYKAGWSHVKAFLSCLPLFLTGFYYWAVGFIQGCVQHDQ